RVVVLVLPRMVRGVGGLRRREDVVPIVVARIAHRRTCDLGFRRSSRAFPTSVKHRTTSTTQAAGGAITHHAPRPGAPDSWALLRIWPHDGWNGSPRPMNESVVSVRTAEANVSTALATIRFTTFGRMWPMMI